MLQPYFTLVRGSFFAHNHAFMELTFITDGRGRHRVAGRSYATQKGDIIICPPGLVHQFVKSLGQTHRNLHFDPRLLDDLKRSAPELLSLTELFPSEGLPARQLRLTPKELVTAELMLHELDAEQKEARLGRDASLQLQFKRLVLFLARIAAKGEAPAIQAQRHLSQELARAYQQIRKNSELPHTLKSLAEEAGLSSSHFRRLFRQAYGESPIKLLVRERVRSTCGLLETTEKNMTEIAYERGFSDSNYYARQFKKIMGTSPSQYRELFRAGN